MIEWVYRCRRQRDDANDNEDDDDDDGGCITLRNGNRCTLRRQRSPHQLGKTSAYLLTVCDTLIEWVCRVLRPTRHITGHFRDESFQAITYTGTDNLKQTAENTPKTKKQVDKFIHR